MHAMKWQLELLYLCFKTIRTLLFIFVILIVQNKYTAFLQLPYISFNQDLLKIYIQFLTSEGNTSNNFVNFV